MPAAKRSAGKEGRGGSREAKQRQAARVAGLREEGGGGGTGRRRARDPRHRAGAHPWRKLLAVEAVR